MKSSETLCIYHANCADGFGAAWAVRAALGNDVAFHPGHYDKPPPDVSGYVGVVLVDFSYKRPVLLEMAKTAPWLTVLDHHKSAAEDLVDLPGNVYTVFDMDRSGAGIAWDFFHPGKPRPPLIDRIEDRDLWRFKYHDTREVQAAVFSHPYDFAVWDKLMDEKLHVLAQDGAAIERKHFKDLKELLPLVTRRVTIAGVEVPIANLPYTLSSDAGNQLAEGEAFSAVYYDTAKGGRYYSLRSRPGGADVSKVALLFGGGGHARASGFTVPAGHPLSRI